MTRRSGCEHELELRRSLRRGEIDRELRDHASGCDDCTDAARVNVWMNRLAAETVAPSTLPDPRILRLKAELFGASPAAQQVLQPLRMLQRAAFALIGLCWVALVAWKWEVIASFSVESVVAGVVSGVSISPSFMTAFLGLASATVLVTVQAALAGE